MMLRFFAFHQCTRFSADPREPYTMALRHIGCYLKNTLDKDIVLKAKIIELNCWVDADSAGLYSKEDPKDSTSIQSHTKYMIALGENPVV